MKEAVRKKKVAYIVWLQQKTSEAKEEYLKAKRGTRRVVRNVQNEEWIEMSKSLHEGFQRNQRRFWKRVTNKNESRVDGTVCDENGVVIVDKKRVMNRWKEYFVGLLGGDAQREEEYSRQDVESEMEEECIGMEEVRAAIAKLKKGKAPGVHGISAEMLKAGGRVVAGWLHMIINLMWMKGEVPAEWDEGSYCVHSQERQ